MFHLIIWFNQFLRPSILHKLAIADVLALRSPHLVLEATLLTLFVGEGTVRVQTRVEPALGPDVSELAPFCGAARAVATQWHRRVLERAMRVLAVGKEFAILFTLVRQLSRW